MVLDSVDSANWKRNYAQALDGLFLFVAGRPLTRALLMGWKATRYLGSEQDIAVAVNDSLGL